MSWITVFLEGDYDTYKYKNVFAAFIHPVCTEFEATHLKCVTYQDMTEAEYKFKDLKTAKAAVKILNKQFRQLPAFLFKGKCVATVMPKDYEKTGSRGIVRPDYHTENVKTKNIKGFQKLKLPAKYIRESPPLPASDYCGHVFNGYTSVKNKKGVCQWKL